MSTRIPHIKESFAVLSKNSFFNDKTIVSVYNKVPFLYDFSMTTKKFKRVNLEISSVCNLACSFCHAGRKHNRECSFMDKSLFETIIPQIAPISEVISVHLMGEPLLHPDFSSILHIAEKCGAKIDVTTNGTLLEAWSSFYKIPCVRQINFSLQSGIDHFHSEIKSNDFKKYFENIAAFVEQASKERPDLFFNFRLWNLKDFSHANDLNKELIRIIVERFGTKDLSAVDEVDIFQKKSVRIMGKIFIHFETLFEWPILSSPMLHEKGFCHGLSSHFGILSDGRVVPCCLDRDGVMTLGDAKTELISEILKKPRSLSIKEGFKNRILIEELCQHCSYITRFN